MTKVWTRYSYYVGVNGNVRIRFTKDSKSRRVNLDDIIMSDYAVASSLSGLNSEKESISIYGNNVVVSNDDGCEISIFNLQGMKLYDYSSDETTVSVSLDKGMYIIKGRYTTKVLLTK